MKFQIKLVVVFSFGIIMGCGGPVFNRGNVADTTVHIGYGKTVSRDSIDDFAIKQGVTRDEAVVTLRERELSRQTVEHAKQYGISEADARKQVVYDGLHQEIPFFNSLNYVPEIGATR